MRMHPFHRTELLLGREGFSRLSGASVCVIGLGGVGGHAAEALARSGVGHLTLVDFDRVCLTNLNRQIHALRSTVGESKAALLGARLADIAPKAELRVVEAFYGPDTADAILDQPYDAVIDAIDNMTAKLHLLRTCLERDLPVWSAMGAGGRLDPTKIHVSDLADTHTDPFARIVRKQLRAEGVIGDGATGIRAVWSSEAPHGLDPVVQEGFRCICPDKADSPHSCDKRLQVQGSVAWLPAVFGMTLAAGVVGDLADKPLAASEVSPGGHARRRVREVRQQPSPNKIDGKRRAALLNEALRRG